MFRLYYQIGMYFLYGILPEIVGKWYSQKPITEDDGTVLLPISTERSEAESGKGEDDISTLIVISHHVAT